MPLPRSRRSRNLKGRKRYAKRRMYRRPRVLRNSFIQFQRKTYLTNWQPSTTTTNDFWKYYQAGLSSMNGYTEITSLFDEYRIAAMKFEFYPRFDSFAGNDTTDATLPGVTNQSGTKLHILVDPSSTLSPTGTYTSANLNSLLENGKVRTYSGNCKVKVYFKPKIYNTVSAVAGQMIRAPWLRTDQSSIPHYGFHVFAQDNNFSGTFGQSWDVFVTYYVQARNIK